MRISEVGPLTILTVDGILSCGFSINLLALPQGFEPTHYDWRMDSGTPMERRATGKEVRMMVSVGSKGSFVYDHEVNLTARDASGRDASAVYTVHANPPAGRLIPVYDDPSSRLSVMRTSEDSGLQLFGYDTVLVKAETEGLVGRRTFGWKVAGRMQEAASDADRVIVSMLVTGDSTRIDSYEGAMVEASIQDEVGQSIFLHQFVEAVVSTAGPE